MLTLPTLLMRRGRSWRHRAGACRRGRLSQRRARFAQQLPVARQHAPRHPSAGEQRGGSHHNQAHDTGGAGRAVPGRCHAGAPLVLARPRHPVLAAWVAGGCGECTCRQGCSLPPQQHASPLHACCTANGMQPMGGQAEQACKCRLVSADSSLPGEPRRPLLADPTAGRPAGGVRAIQVTAPPAAAFCPWAAAMRAGRPGAYVPPPWRLQRAGRRPSARQRPAWPCRLPGAGRALSLRRSAGHPMPC